MKTNPLLRVGRVLERSCANGPGERFVVWVQGCALACPGCFNRELWDPRGGTEMPAEALAERVNGIAGLRGVTISGGEPLEQPQALTALLQLLDHRLDSVIFTGYTWREITADPLKSAAVKCADLIVAGRYSREQASDKNPWAASSNQTVHALTGRILPEEYPACRVEAQITPAGEVLLTGFPTAGIMRI